jgi:hypothetical protein
MSIRRSVSISLIGLLSAVARAAEPARPSPSDASGEWQLTTVYFGEPIHDRLTLKAEKGKLTGSVARGGKTPVTGRVDGDRVRFEWKERDGQVNVYDGRLEEGAMSGTVTLSNEPWGETPPSPWRAIRPAPESGKPPAPRTLDFEPKEFHRVFSATIPPALTIWPGDVVRTLTVDAAGVDEKGKSRVLGGNPQTGPFYVEGAMPGDTIAVHIRRLRLNRPTAVSDDGLVGRAITSDYAQEHKDNAFNDVVWSLDVEKGVARLAKPTEHLKQLEVPVRPMLGCVGVAPGFGGAALRTGDSGRIGGNMDFNEIGEGATVYLAVSQPGALLYLGPGRERDAHHGDGPGRLARRRVPAGDLVARLVAREGLRPDRARGRDAAGRNGRVQGLRGRRQKRRHRGEDREKVPAAGEAVIRDQPDGGDFRRT